MKKAKALTAMTACLFSLIFQAGSTGQTAVYAAPDTSDETAAEQFMDCFEPIPIVGELSSDCWGAADVGARDQSNGLEDAKMES